MNNFFHHRYRSCLRIGGGRFRTHSPVSFHRDANLGRFSLILVPWAIHRWMSHRTTTFKESALLPLWLFGCHNVYCLSLGSFEQRARVWFVILNGLKGSVVIEFRIYLVIFHLTNSCAHVLFLFKFVKNNAFLVVYQKGTSTFFKFVRMLLFSGFFNKFWQSLMVLLQNGVQPNLFIWKLRTLCLVYCRLKTSLTLFLDHFSLDEVQNVLTIETQSRQDRTTNRFKFI